MLIANVVLWKHTHERNLCILSLSRSLNFHCAHNSHILFLETSNAIASILCMLHVACLAYCTTSALVVLIVAHRINGMCAIDKVSEVIEYTRQVVGWTQIVLLKTFVICQQDCLERDRAIRVLNHVILFTSYLERRAIWIATICACPYVIGVCFLCVRTKFTNTIGLQRATTSGYNWRAVVVAALND